ncbi:hypothetical protein F971_01453 [Acinetobacter vivianii]|uniref:Uncharacterized protein n=1 Tax=Acinetobacter vivianii TaxID=1776742 RepID=N8V1A2_9GAMM|nr:hypothetical protein F971_01453 [Acinetobacter vivianii]
MEKIVKIRCCCLVLIAQMNAKISGFLQAYLLCYSPLIWIQAHYVEPYSFSVMFVDYFQLFYDIGMVWASENPA